MFSEDIVLFKQALIEATISKYNEELEQCDEDATFSERHARTMKRIINNIRKASSVRHKKSSNKKRLIAVLVAAIILLFGGLTVYAKRDAIINFVEQIFEKFTKVTYQNDQDNETDIPDSIEKEFAPTYIPKDYELLESVSDLSTNRVVWRNSDGKIIQFEQSIIEAVNDYDNEQGDFEQIIVGEYRVYVVHYESMDSYLWSDEKYAYKIELYDKLPIEEISRIILSVVERE